MTSLQRHFLAFKMNESMNKILTVMRFSGTYDSLAFSTIISTNVFELSTRYFRQLLTKYMLSAIR